MTVQLFYMGLLGFVIAVFCEFLDEKDRFFTPQITEITPYEVGIYLGIGFIGNTYKYNL